MIEIVIGAPNPSSDLLTYPISGTEILGLSAT
jgi:hypothetical protein